MTVDATSQAEAKPLAPLARKVHGSSRPPSAGTRALTDSAARSTLTGELRHPPRSALGTLLLGATGLLVFAHVLAVLGRLTLGLRRPATLEVTPRGIRIEQRTMLLGRVLRARETLVPLDALLRVTREVRFARSGLYAGLAMLALGTYFGVGFLVDGIRAPGGSPSLLFMGLVVMMAGLVLDFGLSSLADGARGRCQVTVIPLRGKALCVGAIEPERADATLRQVASELGIEPEHPEPNARRLVEEIRDRASQSFLARILGGRKERTKGARRAEPRPPRRSSAEREPALSPEGIDTTNEDDEGEDERGSESNRGRDEKEQRGDPAQPEPADDHAKDEADDDKQPDEKDQKDPTQPDSSDDHAGDEADDDELDAGSSDGHEDRTSPAAQDRDSDAAAGADRAAEGKIDGNAIKDRNGEGKGNANGATGEGGDEALAAETSVRSDSTRRLGTGATESQAQDEPTEED